MLQKRDWDSMDLNLLSQFVEEDFEILPKPQATEESRRRRMISRKTRAPETSQHIQKDTLELQSPQLHAC